LWEGEFEMVSHSFQHIADITRYKRTGYGKAVPENLLRSPFQPRPLWSLFSGTR